MAENSRYHAEKAWLVRAWLQEVFRPRELFIRVDGRVRYLTLSTRTQQWAAVAVAAVAFWTLSSTAGLFVQELRLGGKDDYIAAQEDRYAGLLAEIGGYHARYAKIARELEHNQGIALSTLEGGTAASPAAAGRLAEGGAHAAKEDTDGGDRTELTAQLKSFEDKLRQAAERNMALKERVAEITGILTGSAVARLGTAESQASAGEAQDQPARARSGAPGPLADPESVPAATLDQVAALTEDRRRLAWALAESEIGLASLALERGSFEARIERGDDALDVAEARNEALGAGWELRFEALRKERDGLVQQVANLTSHIVELDQRNVQAVTRLSAAAEEATLRLERTIDMTGLSADELLPKQARSSAQGGPYFEDRGDLPDLVDSDLSLALDLLDMKLDRWKALQGLMRAVPLAPPLEQYEISSHFGLRFDPLNNRKARHYGMDFRAPRNASVYTTAPGKVIYAGWYGQFGRLVEVDHGFGIKTRYAHLSEIHVKKGDVVTSRQKIGTLGTSGRSTGPHVHYEVLFNNKPQNPAKFLTAGQNVFKR